MTLLHPSPASAAEPPEIRKLAALLSPAAIERLDRQDFEARLWVVLDHLEATRISQGFPVEEQTKRALALRNFSRKRAALTQEALVDAYRTAKSWHLFEGGQLDAVGKGPPVTIRFGRFAGQRCRVGYVLPPEASPGLAREIANLRLTTNGETPDPREMRRLAAQLTGLLAEEKSENARNRDAAKETRMEKKQWRDAVAESANIVAVRDFLDLVVQSLEMPGADNRQTQKIGIRVTNRSQVPVEAEVEWFILASSNEKEAKFIVGSGLREVRLVPSAAEEWEARTASLSSSLTKRVALDLDGKRAPTTIGGFRKVDRPPLYGWIVRVVAGDRILGVAVSLPELETLARDNGALAKLPTVKKR